MEVLWALAAEPCRRIRRLAAGALLAFVGAAFGLVGIGFATRALFVAVQAQYGAADAAAAVSAAYIVLAAILFAWRAILLSRSAAAGPTPRSRPVVREAANAFAEQIAAANVAQADTIGLGVELAKQLTPVQLVLLSALAGFVGGRKL
jgi:hypothetical protein